MPTDWHKIQYLDGGIEIIPLQPKAPRPDLVDQYADPALWMRMESIPSYDGFIWDFIVAAFRDMWRGLMFVLRGFKPKPRPKPVDSTGGYLLPEFGPPKDSLEHDLRQYVYAMVDLWRPAKGQMHWEMDLAAWNQCRMIDPLGGALWWPLPSTSDPYKLVGLPVKIGEGLGGVGGWPVLVDNDD